MTKVITIPGMDKHSGQKKNKMKPSGLVAWQFETVVDQFVDLGTSPAVIA